MLLYAKESLASIPRRIVLIMIAGNLNILGKLKSYELNKIPLENDKYETLTCNYAFFCHMLIKIWVHF